VGLTIDGVSFAQNRTILSNHKSRILAQLASMVLSRDSIGVKLPPF
jgi:hypothetical protein